MINPKQEKFERGNCFICKEKCRADCYCHYECAVALAEEKERRSREMWDAQLNKDKEVKNGN
jgi:hypothetical protein